MNILKRIFGCKEPYWVIIEPITAWRISKKDQAGLNKFNRWRLIDGTLKVYTEKFPSKRLAEEYVERLLNCCFLTTKYNVFVVPDSQYRKLTFDFKDGLSKYQKEHATIIPAEGRLAPQELTKRYGGEKPCDQEAEQEEMAANEKAEQA